MLFNNHLVFRRNCLLVTQTLKFHQSIWNQKEIDYNVLHTSVLPTMHFQNSLLRLPIPDLEKTCDRYLRSQKAILNESELVDAENVVKEFRNGAGKILQQTLQEEDKANKHTSYISEPWFDMYLSDRAPLVLNYNPFLQFLPEERKGYEHPVIRATNILISSIRFMKTLDQQILEPEVYHLNAAKSDTKFFRRFAKIMPSSLASYAAYVLKAFPLDMSQFENLFNSTRVPQKDKDYIKKSEGAKHMLVMKNGNFYVFDVLDENDNIYSPSHLHACMKYIYDDSAPPPKHPVSILTAQDRNVWAEARDELIKAGNSVVLNEIDSAAFNIVFDEAKVGMDGEKCFKTFLYGDGGNRWFDKSFSLIFTQDGMTALNFEHAWGDGVAVMRYFNEVVKDTQESRIHPDANPANIDASKFVKRLEFKLNPKLENYISDGLKSYEKRTSILAVDILESDLLGKNLCKQFKVSPDSVMQLGFQLAYYLQNGHIAATYESCSTSAFKHGRTETVRSATIETTNFCKIATASNKISNDELNKILHDCSNMHGQLTKEAAMGQGFDRHLFALKNLAKKYNGDAPLFNSASYKKINHIILSTSTLPSPYISCGGFGPVVPDGFGVGYQIQDDKLGIILSSYPTHRNGSEFVECAQKAYGIIKNVMTHSKNIPT